MSSKKEKFLDLCKRAKQLYEKGDDEDIVECLNLYKAALKLNPGNAKLKKKIHKLELILNESMNEEEEEDDEDEEDRYRTSHSKSPDDDKENMEEHSHGGSMIEICEGLKMPTKIYKRLYGYQKEGVNFFFKLFTQKKGGILGDDMGLGKTIQVCSFLSAMFLSRKIKHVIIVLPPPLIINWTNELKKWSPDLNVCKYHEATIKQRAKLLLSLQKDKGVLLTTYNMVVTSVEKLVEYKGRPFIWDYCILDEGHKIKNPSAKTTKALHQLSSHHRIILSGTPIMNNLKELWSLFDWTHHGQLLGSLQTFTESYENPICKSREKDATRTDQRLGEMMGASLQSLIDPYLLRRSKRHVQALQRLKESPSSDDSPRMPELGVKSDLICWLRLSDQQLKVYNDFLTSEEVKNILLNFSRSPLIAITVLKKICDHPRLLSNQKCAMLGVTHEDIENDDEDDNVAFDVSKIPDHVLMCECGKMSFVVHLLEHLKANQHRTLIFSQSRRILDIIQKITTARGHRMLRLDGSIKSMQERQDIIDKFQSDKDIDALLLTSRVGGVGLNLIAADRVIIYDPAWNPSVDSQAIDRAFRIGQQQDVVVYRLITCGTVEEKIYRRQIYKDSVSKKVMKDSKNPTRHFTREEIRSLFKLGNINNSETQVQITTHVPNYRPSATLQSYMQTLLSMPQCTGVSDHDLVFCRDEEDEEGDVVDDDGKSDRYLDGVLLDAFRRLNMESQENKMMQNYQGGGTIKKESRPSYKAHLKQQWSYNDKVNKASIQETVEDLPEVLKQYAYKHTDNTFHDKIIPTTNNNDTKNNYDTDNSVIISSTQQNPIVLYSDNDEVFDDVIVKSPVNDNDARIDVIGEVANTAENKAVVDSNNGNESNVGLLNTYNDNTDNIKNSMDKLHDNINDEENESNDDKTNDDNNCIDETKKFGGLFINVDEEEEDDDQDGIGDETNKEKANDDGKIRNVIQEDKLGELVMESTDDEGDDGENDSKTNIYKNDFSVEESDFSVAESEEDNFIHNRNKDYDKNINNEQDITKAEDLHLKSFDDEVAESDDETLDNDLSENIGQSRIESENPNKTNENTDNNEAALDKMIIKDDEDNDKDNKKQKDGHNDGEEKGDIQHGDDENSLFESTDDAVNNSNSLADESLLMTGRKKKKTAFCSSGEESGDEKEYDNDEKEEDYDDDDDDDDDEEDDNDDEEDDDDEEDEFE